jgi:hypothetical protein
MRKLLFLSMIILLSGAFYCSGGQQRTDIPVTVPEDITLQNAKKIINEATKLLAKADKMRLGDIAPSEMLRARDLLKNARTQIADEEPEEAFYAAGKSKAYLELIFVINDYKKAKRIADEFKKTLK